MKDDERFAIIENKENKETNQDSGLNLVDEMLEGDPDDFETIIGG